MLTPAPSAMSRMLSGRPSWPIRSAVGSTSVTTFSGRNVTLYFFVGRFTFAGAVLTPPPALAILPLDAVNFRPRADATVLYTAAYGTTPGDSTGRLAVELPLRVADRRGDRKPVHAPAADDDHHLAAVEVGVGRQRRHAQELHGDPEAGGGRDQAPSGWIGA